MTTTVLAALDWALIAISFFNTIAMLWLGLTVLLNAERRAWGTWLAGGGLLFGGLFFVVHSSIVGQPLWEQRGSLAVWWRLGWLPFVGAPYLWYLVMAWFAGMLGTRRHRIWAIITGVLGLAAVALLFFGEPLPSYGDIIGREPVPIFMLGGVPVAALVYPVYSTLCIVLALVALRRPAASERFMGDLGRQRARPWLVVASLALLVVSLAVGAAVIWLLDRARAGTVPALSARSLVALLGFDLAVSALLAVVVVLLGKAIVSYEIFTGKALPRGGLSRYWRSSLILAAGYGVLVGGSLYLPIAPVNQVLIATLLVTLLYALLSWRAFIDRERTMERLRPFVASQHLYERVLGPVAPAEVDIAAPFRALCAEVLDARVAYLVALGSLAPLVGEPLAYRAPGERDAKRLREQAEVPTRNALQTALSQLAGFTPQVLCVPLAPEEFGGAVWAVPLWSERGLVGALLLGPKRDGGLYTQEEIEIARAAGERLIDAQAGAELSRRLTDLQRRRLAESQVLDRRTRRVLHDDVLPRIHTALLQIAAEQRDDGGLDSNHAQQLQTQLTEIHQQVANLLRALPPSAESELARLGLAGALRYVVEGELDGSFDGITWDVAAGAERAARSLPAINSEVLFFAAREAIRNAARYGRADASSRPLHLTVTMRCDAASAGESLALVIEDDGVGLDHAPPQAGGSGQGLVLHGAMMALLGGTLVAESCPTGGARVALALPITVESAARS